MAPPSEPEEEGLPPGMARYVYGVMRRGPHWGTGTPEENDRIQRAHVGNNLRMRASGHVLVAGPFLDSDDPRGIIIFRDLPEATIRALVADDPAIASGRLVLDLRPWLTYEGLRTDDPP
jgi:uncharacterized protein